MPPLQSIKQFFAYRRLKQRTPVVGISYITIKEKEYIKREFAWAQKVLDTAALRIQYILNHKIQPLKERDRKRMREMLAWVNHVLVHLKAQKLVWMASSVWKSAGKVPYGAQISLPAYPILPLVSHNVSTLGLGYKPVNMRGRSNRSAFHPYVSKKMNNYANYVSHILPEHTNYMKRQRIDHESLRQKYQVNAALNTAIANMKKAHNQAAFFASFAN